MIISFPTITKGSDRTRRELRSGGDSRIRINNLRGNLNVAISDMSEKIYYLYPKKVTNQHQLFTDFW